MDEARKNDLPNYDGGIMANEFLRELAGRLDYLHHEAFSLVSPTFEVAAYRTPWFGLQYDSETVEQGETVGNGVLTTVRWYDGEPAGDGHLPGQFTALKDVVGEVIDKGVFTPLTARQYLKRKRVERVGADRSCSSRLMNHRSRKRVSISRR